MSRHPRFLYERLFPADLRRLAVERPVAYLGLGPLEWHGEHLAFCTDPARAAALVRALWRREGGALLPPLHLGIDRELEKDGETLRGMETFAGMRLPGTILVDEATLAGALSGIASSLERNGFRLLVLCTGHWAQNQVALVHRLSAERRDAVLRLLAWPPADLEWPERLRPFGAHHAGVEESSEMAFISPRSVRAARMGGAEGDRRVDLLAKYRPAVSRSLGRARFFWELGELERAFAEAVRGL